MRKLGARAATAINLTCLTSFTWPTTSASHWSYDNIDQHGRRDEKPGFQGYSERGDIAERRQDHRGGGARSELQLHW
jgi:hypothetical protein